MRKNLLNLGQREAGQIAEVGQVPQDQMIGFLVSLVCRKVRRQLA